MNERVCLVTGANRGIGRATAEGLARLGATVLMVCCSRERGEAAETAVYLASSPEVEGVSSKHFVEKKMRKLSKASYDEELGRRLWEVSLELTQARDL